MVPNKSQDQKTVLLYLITAVVRDVQTLHSEVISPESLRKTVQKIVSRVAMEGLGFLTKALPRLGKALDRALSGEVILDAVSVGFKPMPNSKLPLLLGELFQRVFAHDGRVLSDPCVRSIKSLRQVLYLAYKYELPYDTETESQVLSKFERTEEEVAGWSKSFSSYADWLDYSNDYSWWRRITPPSRSSLIRRARALLFALFRHFDIHDIHPRHGPGAVSTAEKLWEKWTWTRISPRITETYPLDSFFYANLSHVGDRLQELSRIEMGEDSARVVLVPKDSRGPRLISCEPLAFQWIQQGLGRAIMDHVERHPLTKYNVHFTDQVPNQKGALLGSSTGKYATLDLNEASDRVSVGLVKLLFPGPLVGALMNCRSLSTELPGGRILTLHKFAPMGSALCFPVLALVVWAILTAGAPDADTRDGILVYGDDVVVPSGYATRAIELLETVGLKVNRDKSFITGLFRESCGVDAFNGENVTPVRLRTLWSSSRCPEALASWTEYANSFYQRSYFYTYELIAGWLLRIYKRLPDKSQVPNKACPYLMEVPREYRPRSRFNRDYQRSQLNVWALRPRTHWVSIDGWSMLFRYFTEVCCHSQKELDQDQRLTLFCLGLSALSTDQGGRRAYKWDLPFNSDGEPFRVCSYTEPRSTKLVRRWL